jgi:hypothetical protein
MPGPIQVPCALRSTRGPTVLHRSERAQMFLPPIAAYAWPPLALRRLSSEVSAMRPRLGCERDRACESPSLVG